MPGVVTAHRRIARGGNGGFPRDTPKNGWFIVEKPWTNPRNGMIWGGFFTFVGKPPTLVGLKI